MAREPSYRWCVGLKRVHMGSLLLESKSHHFAFHLTPSARGYAVIATIRRTKSYLEPRQDLLRVR